MKKLLTILMLILFIVPSQAVLNESDLVHTLQVLRDELVQLKKRQEENLKKYKMFDEMQHEKMLDLIQRSNQTALILFSQKQDYIFNLTYACNEATDQYNEFKRQQQPYYGILSKVESDIERYDRLIESLMALPPRIIADTLANEDGTAIHQIHHEGHSHELSDSVALKHDHDSISTMIVDSLLTTVNGSGRKNFMLTPQQQAVRDSCINIAKSIRDALIDVHNNIVQDSEDYIATGERLKKLNDYAEEKYEFIKQNIFKNGETNFVTMIIGFPYYLDAAIHDIKEKYIETGEEHVKSQWKGPKVIFFTFIVVFYLMLAILLCNIVIRFVVPARLKGENFEHRKNYYITACSMVLFSVVLFMISYFVNDNFFKMASSLLVEFTLLMSAIVASLLFRLKPQKIKYGVRLYLPIMAMGFFVILFRIIFVPNSVVSLVFPPVLLIATIFQYTGVKKYSHSVESVDKFYTWISFATILISCIASWCGFTLLAVQIFMWWMMQLTCIHGITCCYDAMKIYEDKFLLESIKDVYESEESQKEVMTAYHAKNGKYFKLTWFGDLLNMTIIPLLTVFSIPLCIYWAADIFDMSETCKDVFLYDFIKFEDAFELSLIKIVAVSGMYFIFKFINYILRSAYNYHVEHSSNANAQANIALGNNIISIVIWGIFFIIALVLMNVPSSGISIVTAGLATGVGFAMKDILNNFFYGISLMAGRVRVGEIIECDGIRGTVHSITYQSTQIQTLDGSIIAFLNSNLFASSFKNLTRNHDYEFVKVPIGVAYGTDFKKVKELLLNNVNKYIAEQSKNKPNIDPEKGANVIFSGFGDSSVDLYVVFWVRVLTKLKTCSEINEIIYTTLNENNIEIPFPQRDIHMR
ncbi:MAG: mechanosensitive ion channel [Bacteroidales bacterium]|nr:mechanosensitive ion channel [Bacteroidales bacterium]